MFEGGEFYVFVDMKIVIVVQLFECDDLIIYLGFRNLVMLVFDVFVELKVDIFVVYLYNIVLDNICWVFLVEWICCNVLDVKLVVWCNEDIFLIWVQFICLLGGVDVNMCIVGGYDLFVLIMIWDGMFCMLIYLKLNLLKLDVQKCKIMVIFLECYVVEEEFI